MELVRERELKLDVDRDWVMPDVGASVPRGGNEAAAAMTLSSTYFDTSAHDLYAAGVTLRRRHGASDQGWQAKIPDGRARVELQVPDSDDIPAELLDVLTGVRRGLPLEPIAQIETRRTARQLLNPAGRTMAELVDDQVRATTLGAAATVQTWRELEVELVDGDERFLRKVVKRLRTAGACTSGAPSKLGRALGHVTESSADGSPRNLISGYLAEQRRRILAGDLQLRLGNDQVHKTRVAVRRYRSTLRVFADVIDVEARTRLDEELSWYGEVLGAVRDPRVLLTLLEADLEQLDDVVTLGPVANRMQISVGAAEREAARELTAAMSSGRYLALLGDLRRWDEAPPVKKVTRKALGKHVDRAAAKPMKRLRRAATALDRDAEYHRARKAAKRARYAAEVAEPAMGKAAKRIRKQAERLQDALGEVHDSTLAADVLRRLGALAGTTQGENGFTFGILWQRQQQRHERALEKARNWCSG